MITMTAHHPPTEIRLLKIGDQFCDDQERVYRKVGIQTPNENSRLGKKHLATLVSGPRGNIHEFRAQALVYRLEDNR